MPHKPQQQDNQNPDAKLALRRRLLALHPGELRVLDCCQGEMRLWEKLRAEFPVQEYLGVDLKPKPGRLKIDSVRLLDAPGWKWNVIDVDTYGLPWTHWSAILRHLRHPATIFLTIGRKQITTADNISLEAAGLRFQKLKLPISITVKIMSLLEDASLGAALHQFHVHHASEAVAHHQWSSSLTRYIGLQLEPKRKAP
jgi:hypothetical protein